MKSIKLAIFTILAVTGLAVTSCDKDLTFSESSLRINEPTDIDEDAGNWRMVVLSGPGQVALPALGDTTTVAYRTAYRAEINTIKTAQKNLTAEQKRIIKYWSVGGAIRWNQFMRELVARFNLPPAPKADDTYPVPDAENPFADPNFPFANPPYAARAYAYVSVAQYEAMKAAWYYKYLYNRQSPYKYNTAVQSLMPETDLPSYPSEDAVMSGVSADMLKSLFPAAVEEITLKAAEQRNAALWSGRASVTDISAGLALGKGIAAAVLTGRAGTDGMRTAGGSPAIWKQLADSVGFGKLYHQNQTGWVSQDTPKRPPMLPVFGQVSAWCMTRDQINAERPVAPPSTSSEEMKAQLAEVKKYSEGLTREQLSIVHRWADGAGTYTPPGHWNDIATEYISEANWSEVRMARAYALLNMTLHDAAVGCWETKFYYFNPRPSQLDPSIKTSTGLPNFPAYTSGHSTFSGAAATLLSHLFPSGAASFNEQAKEASISRLYGSIHYRADIEMGMEHGIRIGEYTIAYAETDGGE